MDTFFALHDELHLLSKDEYVEWIITSTVGTTDLKTSADIEKTEDGTLSATGTLEGGKVNFTLEHCSLYLVTNEDHGDGFLGQEEIVTEAVNEVESDYANDQTKKKK